MTTVKLDVFSALPEWSDVFRSLWPKQTRKRVAAALGVPERRAKDLLETKARPKADEIFRMAVSDVNARSALFQILRETRHVEQKVRSQMHSSFGALVGGGAVADRDAGEPAALALCPLVEPRRLDREAAFVARAEAVRKR